MAIVLTLDPTKKKPKSFAKYLGVLTTAATAQDVVTVNRLLNRYRSFKRMLARGYLTVTGN